MSTIRKSFITAALILLVLLVIEINAFSQDLEIEIKLRVSERPRAEITVRNMLVDGSLEPRWSFTDSYADAENLAERVKGLKVSGRNHREIGFTKLNEGEFLAESPPLEISYAVQLPVPERVTSTAHISWIKKDQGLIMLNDILPKFGKAASARVKFLVHENWKITSSEKRISPASFDVMEIEDAVFLVGIHWNEEQVAVDRADLTFSIVGDWQFRQEEGFQMAFEIFREYRRLLGNPNHKRVQVNLLRFPSEIGVDRWRAETRGSTVTIVSSLTAFKSSAAQRLHEQLRHELIHLWIPNGLNLSGDYAWFYEGFAVYQSLKTGVRLGQIRFQDYLNTLSYAVNSLPGRKLALRLGGPSNERWKGPAAGVYAAGMLVAFMTDIALLRKSRGEKDLTAVFESLLNRHNKSSERVQANAAILRILKGFPELRPIVNKYVENGSLIDWTEYLDSIGVEEFGNPGPVRLRIKNSVNGRQKALLKELGYNKWQLFLRKTRSRSK